MSKRYRLYFRSHATELRALLEEMKLWAEEALEDLDRNPDTDPGGHHGCKEQGLPVKTPSGRKAMATTLWEWRTDITETP